MPSELRRIAVFRELGHMAHPIHVFQELAVGQVDDLKGVDRPPIRSSSAYAAMVYSPSGSRLKLKVIPKPVPLAPLHSSRVSRRLVP